jgi:hypothetical protein
MAYESIWWTLSQALERVMAATGRSEDEVKADICRAIADRVINFLGKLGKHVTKNMTSDEVLAGDGFEIPHEIKPEGLDWEHSRPLKAWAVRRERYKIPGLWDLEWIKVSGPDVTEHLCRPGKQEAAPQLIYSDASRRKPSRERVEQAIKEIYPQGVPTQANEPNTMLCKRVSAWLKERRLPSVSDDTILRAAGRRK